MPIFSCQVWNCISWKEDVHAHFHQCNILRAYGELGWTVCASIGSRVIFCLSLWLAFSCTRIQQSNYHSSSFRMSQKTTPELLSKRVRSKIHFSSHQLHRWSLSRWEQCSRDVRLGSGSSKQDLFAQRHLLVGWSWGPNIPSCFIFNFPSLYTPPST